MTSFQPSLTRFARLCALSIAGSLLLPLAATAQRPELNGVVYSGVQRGTTGSVLVDGKNLQGAKVLISGSGVKVESVQPNATHDYAEIKLSAAPDAPLGPREIRIATDNGVSGPGSIWIDPFPQIHSAEANYDLLHAQMIEKTPIVINGRIAQNPGRHCFQFNVLAGETWTFDANCARIRSQTDPVLELRDDSAHLLKMAQSTWDNDPRLVYRFEKAGRYFLTIRDTQFQGGVNYNYLLTIGALPLITRYQPLGGVGTFTLRTEGINCAKASVPVQFPPGTAAGETWIAPMTDRGLALPIPLITDPVSATTVAESRESFPVPALPANLDGDFMTAPLQRFSFHAVPADPLVFDLLGRRIGSRIDGALRVLDAAGKELIANDDTVGKDALLEFSPPADAVYTLEIRNVEGVTGPDCFYRLSVHRVAPDYQLRLAVDSLNVAPGGTVEAQVEAVRTAGFSGAIQLTAEGLAPGIRFSGGVLPAGQNTIEVTFTAKPEASRGAAAIHLLGSADIGGKVVRREAVARLQYLPRSIDPGLFTDDSYRRPYHNLVLLPLGVSSEKPVFTLELAHDSLTLNPGQKSEITVRAVRTTGVNGEIKLELHGLPDKVTATVPPIPANQSETKITLTAAADAALTVRNLILTGRIDPNVLTAPAFQLIIRK